VGELANTDTINCGVERWN